ncbi:SIR2_2 domain-containing protein [Helicobacter sp. NHP19-003]|uniref:SIR2_2 domain-containing protein n=1 Tax=Helicobacter gastrocanis TaxID=2849641 RepID=A0ABN6I1N2_9HELI|nr:SIR2 family protein [Helicobacter sp. NHP19-003]BCZ17480.1 SIR2_2 domain-containing protein [Helicobacter sp. NHP19-003]
MAGGDHQIFIETSLENIKKAHNENYLSIFAGAGISAGSKLPSWDGLMEALRSKLYGDAKRDEAHLNLAKKFSSQHGALSQNELVDLIKRVEEQLKEKLYDEIKRDRDHLVLAEKFFNQFGNNVYYRTLSEVLKTPDGNDAEPNTLHLEIVKLNLGNLITTNWDNLFEKAISAEGMFFDIIKADADMGDSAGFSKLIKIHGSLDRRNIVFREKDYLEYSQNFPLIENYIKGVFSTDLVVLVGYSLSDPNVKQIISWVNSCSKNVKPIYFIKTNAKFEPIEFGFYQNKNIHVLYLSEVFGKGLDNAQEHVEELKDFFKEIKEKHGERLVLKNHEVQDIGDILLSFDFNVLQQKIDALEMSKELSLKDKLLKYFLLFENRIDDEIMLEIYQQCQEVFAKTRRNKESKIWFSSQFNKCWGFYPGECNNLDSGAWEDFLLELPLNEKSTLKRISRLENYFEQQVARIRSCWENRGYSDPNDFKQEILEKLQEFNRTRIGNCLIIPRLERHRMVYTRALECYWCQTSIDLRSTNNMKREIPILPVNEEIFSHSVKYFQTRELKEIFREYFTGVTFCIKINEDFLEKMFKGICSKFKTYGAFTTRGSRWFDNFLFLASYCSLTQNAFDSMIKKVNDKIQEHKKVVSLVQYERIGHFIDEQSKNNALDLQKCLALVLSYLNLFVEDKAGGYEMEAQQIFSKIVEKIKITGEKYQKLITGFIDKIHQKYIRFVDNGQSSFPEGLEAMIDVQAIQYNQTFLPLIKALHQSGDEDVKKAIKDKLQCILDHKEDYAQTKAHKKYCPWLEKLLQEMQDCPHA